MRGWFGTRETRILRYPGQSMPASARVCAPIAWPIFTIINLPATQPARRKRGYPIANRPAGHDRGTGARGRACGIPLITWPKMAARGCSPFGRSAASSVMPAQVDCIPDRSRTFWRSTACATRSAG